jgi:hypothetical protein
MLVPDSANPIPAAYPDAALVSIAEFLSAHCGLLNRYLAAVAPATGSASSGTPASAGDDT